jgi:hypothetical protein
VVGTDIFNQLYGGELFVSTDIDFLAEPAAGETVVALVQEQPGGLIDCLLLERWEVSRRDTQDYTLMAGVARRHAERDQREAEWRRRMQRARRLRRVLAAGGALGFAGVVTAGVLLAVGIL